jgi:hypothetical protein
MDIKRRTCDIWNWENYLFLAISSTNTDTLALYLYQCFETRSIEVFFNVVSANSAPPFHYLRISNILERISRPNCEPLYTTNTSDCKQETFLCEYPLHWVHLATKKKTQNNKLLFGITPLKHGCHFDYWIQRMRVCYLRLSWSWTVLLPSDTHRKPLTSITDVFLFTDSRNIGVFSQYLRGTDPTNVL